MGVRRSLEVIAMMAFQRMMIEQSVGHNFLGSFLEVQHPQWTMPSRVETEKRTNLRHHPTSGDAQRKP